MNIVNMRIRIRVGICTFLPHQVFLYKEQGHIFHQAFLNFINSL